MNAPTVVLALPTTRPLALAPALPACAALDPDRWTVEDWSRALARSLERGAALQARAWLAATTGPRAW